MLWGFFDTVGFAMARAMVLPWAATVSATARAMGTIICHVAWQRHDRWQPVGLAMETHGLRWQPMAYDGSPRQAPRVAMVTAIVCHQKVK